MAKRITVAPNARLVGIAVLTLLYPLLDPLTRFLPNPMVPGASVALNMIFPVLAGYFYGPLSGAAAGSLGTGLSALVWASSYDGAAVLPHLLMGLAGGWVGQYRSEILAALTILVGHALNMLFFLRLGLLTIAPDQVGPTLLGLAAETMVDIVAIVLIAILFKSWLYQEKRW